MRVRLFVLWAVVLLAVLNGLIVQKQSLLRSGRVVLLELAPVDPRSLIQGDYMRLRYHIEQDLLKLSSLPSSGAVVVTLDTQGVGHYAHLDEGAPLQADEQRLRYTSASTDIHVGPEAFYFEEGQAAVYNVAHYGELRVAPDGTCLLSGLRDEHLHPLGPQSR